jgi:hypothetical protein
MISGSENKRVKKGPTSGTVEGPPMFSITIAVPPLPPLDGEGMLLLPSLAEAAAVAAGVAAAAAAGERMMVAAEKMRAGWACSLWWTTPVAQTAGAAAAGAAAAMRVVAFTRPIARVSARCVGWMRERML